MRPPRNSSVFAIFIIFFGISLLDAVRDGHWLSAVFLLSVGVVFLILGSHNKSGII